MNSDKIFNFTCAVQFLSSATNCIDADGVKVCNLFFKFYIKSKQLDSEVILLDVGRIFVF